ncbi:AzlD domain-containing protein [Crenalkalicoccus roseus]|uniref:AzlD domain-containing protein n=1 Tax=Crenalkalicoccus roseus TaxID=1485588 RepID=UPI0010815EA6|nr:AzlD domain-containing protein [Crenalkalicoccus roseus]
MAAPDLALLLAALAMLALRGAGLLVAGALRPEHPFIAWATAVSQATLAAFVALAVLAPVGILATVPLPARLAGLAAGLLGFALLRGRLLPALGLGLGALVAVRLALGG